MCKALFMGDFRSVAGCDAVGVLAGAGLGLTELPLGAFATWPLAGTSRVRVVIAGGLENHQYAAPSRARITRTLRMLACYTRDLGWAANFCVGALA